jgi:hypothetical protein
VHDLIILDEPAQQNNAETPRPDVTVNEMPRELVQLRSSRRKQSARKSFFCHSEAPFAEESLSVLTWRKEREIPRQKAPRNDKTMNAIFSAAKEGNWGCFGKWKQRMSMEPTSRPTRTSLVPAAQRIPSQISNLKWGPGFTPPRTSSTKNNYIGMIMLL